MTHTHQVATVAPVASTSTRFPAADADRYRSAGAWGGRSVDHLILEAARRHPSHLAIAKGEESVTYGDLDELTARLACALLDCGLTPGDRVLLQLGNEIDSVLSLLAAQRAGMVPVSTLPNHGRYEIEQVATFLEARGMIVQARYRNYDLVGQARELTETLPGLDVVISLGVHDASDVPSVRGLIESVPLDRAQERLAPLREMDRSEMDFLIHLTGGTTGLPKLIPHAPSSYLSLVAGYVATLGLTSEDRWLYATPIVHNAGTVTGVYPCLVAGATLVLSASISAEDLRSTFQRWQPTGMTAQPIIAKTLIDEGDGWPDPVFGTLRIVGFTRNDPATAAELEAVTQARVVGLFGMSEGPLLACAPDDDQSARFETSGRVCGPGVEARVVDPVTEEVLPDGKEGELRFRGASVIPAYLGIDSTAYYDSAGFLRTGDVAVQVTHEDRPYFTIKGRYKDTISRGGEKYLAAEVEHLIASHPRVAEVAIIGRPDPTFGERAHAFVTLTDAEPLALGDVVAFLAELGVAKYKYPEFLTVLDHLPRTSLGAMKVDKNQLRTRAGTLG